MLSEMLKKRCHVALVLDGDEKMRNIFNYYQGFQQIGDLRMEEVDSR